MGKEKEILDVSNKVLLLLDEYLKIKTRCNNNDLGVWGLNDLEEW